MVGGRRSSWIGSTLGCSAAVDHGLRHRQQCGDGDGRPATGDGDGKEKIR